MITDYLQICFSGANLPASVLLVLVMVYWLLAILAGLDLDLFDFDLDMDAEPDFSSAVGVGLVVFRFVNIGRVPIMIWMSVFTVTYWLLSMLLDRLLDNPDHRETLFFAVQYGVRNFAIAVVLAKIFTQPLRDKFDAKEPNTAEYLIGRECVITTTEVTESFGQARYKTEAAPLLLNVRAREEPLAKGDLAVIVDHDAEENVYFVTKANSEVQ